MHCVPSLHCVPSRAAALLVVLLLSGSAWAFSVTTAVSGNKNFKRWFDNKVTYHIHPVGSDNLTPAVSHAELVAGFAGWMAPICSGLNFVEGYHCNTALGKCLYDKGASCTKNDDCPAAKNLKVMPIGYNANGRNELVFIEDAQWKHGNYVLGVTVAWANNYQGAIVESDIAFNGYLQKWTTNPNKTGNGTQHLLSVAIHEQGHFFGVMHNLGGWSQSDPPTMAPNVMPGNISASLNSDDQKAACFLNPKSGSYACKNDADCPYVVQRDNNTGKEYFAAKLSCSSGSCVWAGAATGGNEPLGSDCVSDTECATGLFCQAVSGAEGYCAKTCSVSQASCPSGFTCYPYASGNDNGVCLKPFGGTTKKENGAACTSAGECKSLLCAGGLCAKKCIPGQPAQCATDQICEAVPGSSGACVAKKEDTLKDVGEECAAPEECGSGVCMKDNIDAVVGHCRVTCTAPGSCVQGFKCVSQGQGYTGCVPGKEELPSGHTCASDDVCAGGICVPAGDAGSLCSNVCDPNDATTCPCGMVCTKGTKGQACYLGKPVACLDVGAPCIDGGECVSGVCNSGSCQPGCIIGTTEACDLGYGCLRLAVEGAKGFCEVRGKVADGNFCVADAVCASLLCVKDADGLPSCTRACVDGQANDCPSGSGCVAPTSAGCAAGGACVPVCVDGADTMVDANSGGTDAGGMSSDGAASPVSDGISVEDAAGGSNVPPVQFAPATPSGCSANAARGTGGGAPVFAGLMLLCIVCLRRLRQRARRHAHV